MVFKEELIGQIETFTDKNFIIPIILADITLIPIFLSYNLASNLIDSLIKVITIDLVLIICYLILWILFKYMIKYLFIKLRDNIKLINQKINPYYRIKRLEEQINRNIPIKKMIIPSTKINPIKLKRDILKLDKKVIELLKYLVEHHSIFVFSLKSKLDLSFVEIYNLFQDLSEKGILVSDSKPIHNSSHISLNPDLLKHDKIILWLINYDNE